MATKDDLIREVLGELFSLASGQTPSTEDSTWVEQRINTTLASLSKRNVIYLPEDDDIPDEAFDGLVAYMAEICGPKFGRPRDHAAKKVAEDELRTVQRIGSGTGGPLNLPTALVATGRRRWVRF